MTDQEILQKAIEKAVANGFKQEHTQHIYLVQKVFGANTINKEWLRGFILSHDFAKAFYGEDAWQMRLQQQVLEKNPIKYLEKFL